MRRLDSQAALEEGIRALVARDPALAGSPGPAPRLRRQAPGYAGLARIVVGQQVSTASADAIWGRLHAALDPLTPARLSAATDEVLRTAGLSRPKIRTLRAAAVAAVSGALPLEALGGFSGSAARERLTAVHGIGPWTAEVYLLFCLGDADAFPAGDLALQEGARHLLGAPARPDARELERIAEERGWRPWRGVAAHLLWQRYRAARGREGAPDGTGAAGPPTAA